jgi:predicted Rossmann fold nucleotide-binding protein DprA/Smf involved in DNA uptake
MVYLESKEAKRIPDNARLIAVVPFKGHRPSKGWLDIHREVSEKADEVITVANKFSPGAYPERNRLMVDRSSRLIRHRAGMTGGTAHTVNYAANKGLKIIDLAGLIPKGS